MYWRSRAIKNNLVIDELNFMMKLLGLLCYGISQEKRYILNFKVCLALLFENVFEKILNFFILFCFKLIFF